MKRWQEPELKDLSLKATKNEQPECPNKPDNVNVKCTLPKDICCNCPFNSCCIWPWKYQGSCDVIS